MALSKVLKLYVSSDHKKETPVDFDRAWTIHEALTKIDLIDYVEIKIDSEISESLYTDHSGVLLDSETVLMYANIKSNADISLF